MNNPYTPAKPAQQRNSVEWGDKDIDHIDEYSLEAEQCVIGGLVLAGGGEHFQSVEQALELVQELLPDPLAFWHPATRYTYLAILRIVENTPDVSPDLVSISEFLEKQINQKTGKSYLEEIGGISIIATMIKNVPSCKNLLSYAEIVRKYWKTREVIDSATQIAISAREVNHAGSLITPELVVEQHIESLSQLIDRDATVKEYSMADSVDSFLNDTEGDNVIATGFKDLDEIIGGFAPKDTILIPARSNVGKTMLILNIMLRTAMRGVPSLFFSMEQSRHKLAMRLICMVSGLPSKKINNNAWATELSKEELEKFMHAKEVVENLPISIIDVSTLTPTTIRTHLRRWVRKTETEQKFVAIDHMGLLVSCYMSETGRYSEQGATREVSRAIKRAAKDFEVPIVTLTQMNKSFDEVSKQGGFPDMSFIPYTGEDDADKIIFLHRPAYNDTNKDPHEAYLVVAKSKDTAVGSVPIHADMQHFRFDNQDHTDKMWPWF